MKRVAGVLDLLEVPYLIGGSVASGSFGLPRQTNDIDIVADFRNVDLREFCELLEGEFYVDLETVSAAVQQLRSFNVIHLRAALKFDFFPAGEEGFTQSELGRRRYSLCAIPGLEGVEIPMSSPEDTILAKLRWYRAGGQISDRQWSDILGVLSVQGNRLDQAYMHLWAERMAVLDLLQQALAESRPG